MKQKTIKTMSDTDKKEERMKKKGFKRAVTLLLTLTMTASLFVGCSKKEKGEETSVTQPPKKEETNKTDPTQEAEKPSNVDKFAEEATAASNGIVLPDLPNNTLKLVVNIADFNQSSEGTMIQEEWQKRMEAYLGCKLDITWNRSANYSENELIVLQSGRVPDIATVNKGLAMNEYGEDKTLLNLADYKDYMVYYPDFMAQTTGGEDFARNEDGSMYYFMDGFYNPGDIEGAQSFTSFAYRFDILRKLGLEPATTLDEFTQLIAAIQEKINDGTINITYPIMNSQKEYPIYRGFVGIFRTWDCVYYNGSEWVFGPLEDNFREMLRYINGLYEAGYIDPEFATSDYNQGMVKATTNVAAVCPTLWSGAVANWNSAKLEDDTEWGLAFLPEKEGYGTPWKWGSRKPGKSLNANMGIYISGKTEHPEHVVAMIDYQYSDQLIKLMNWGLEGVTYNTDGDNFVYIDEIMKDEKPAVKSAEYGLMASSVCRTGIPYMPLDFRAMLDLSSLPEPWWSPSKGYYEGKYWIESSENGGKDSVSPYDRPPVTYLSAEEQAAKAQISYNGVCEARVKEWAVKFMTGEVDIDNDADWQAYIRDVKSQTDEDFDSILIMLNEKTVK